MTKTHKPLRDDVRLLGELLGETLRPRRAMRAVRARRAGARARQTLATSDDALDADDVFEALAGELRAMPADAALPVARSFAHFLNLANIAEQHHRMRRRRAYQRDPNGRPQQGSIEETLPRLARAGLSADALYDVGPRTANRARHHRPPDRDHAADAAAQSTGGLRERSPTAIART